MCVVKNELPDLEILKEYPNLQAVVDGRTSQIEWYGVRRELLALLEQLEGQHG
jgi:hypothetical protein